MPLIIPANTLADTGFSVDNSCRFDAAGDADMQKTFVSGNQDRWTFSCWVKNCGLGGQDAAYVFSWYEGNSDVTQLNFENPNHTLRFLNRVGSSTKGNLVTTRVFRDPAAWYHIVIVWDSGNVTAGNRMRMYVNGVEETVFGTDANPDQDQDSIGNKTDAKCIIGNKEGGGGGTHFDGYLAEVVFIDGTVYAASDFGEFDEDSPTIWKPKKVSGLTFGTNGFYLDFKDSANLGNDANGGTDLTEANLAAVDQSQDSPTNNFCTMNPLDNFYPVATFSEGNNTLLTQASAYSANTATQYLTAGKWYWETRFDSDDGSDWYSGLTGTRHTAAQYLGSTAQDYMYWSSGSVYHNSSATSSGYGAITEGSGILGIYLDIDNSKLYYAVDGTIQNSGTGISLVALSTLDFGAWTPAFGDGGSGTATVSYNFGNGSFGSSAVSSSNADANGYGLFEFSPNDGGSSSFDSAAKDFLAICTKNLGSDGG